MSPDLPAPAAAEPPSRKTMRSWLLPHVQRSTARAVALVLTDTLLFAAITSAIVVAPSLWLKLLLGVLSGLVIGRLFIIGHDACHQSLTSHSRFNTIVGRAVFLPSLTPYSLWDTGHNVIHHGYTNLRGTDFVWAPLSRDEYQALSPAARWRERVYRSGWAPGLYYGVEIWWKRLFFPSARYMPTRRAVFMRDSAAVLAFALLWIALLLSAARLTEQSPALLLVAGFILPQLVWNSLIGFVVYVHHTHREIAWHQSKAQWLAAQPFVTTTVHLRFRRWLGIDIGAALHHIMEHTAHHVDMRIPLYRLRHAQQLLEQRMPGRIVVQDFTWCWYFKTAKACKLYDFDRQQWTDFDGRPTATTSSTTVIGAAA